MRTLRVTTIVLMVIFTSSLTTFPAGADEKHNLEVLEIKPEPVRNGRNVVKARIRNTANEEQAFSIDVRTETTAGNWQTQFPHVIAPGQTKWIRQAYKIDGPVREESRMRFRFFTTGPEIDVRGRRKNHYFKEVTYSAGDVKRAEPDAGTWQPTPEDQSAAVTKALQRFQGFIKNKDYAAAWQCFSRDFQDAEQQGRFEMFEKSMETPYWLLFPLSRTELLGLEPKSAGRRNDVVGLVTTLNDEQWTVNFVKVAGAWRIDALERVNAAPRETIPLDPEAQEQAVQKAFEQWQNALRGRKYKTAWGCLADGLRRSRQLGNDYRKFTQQLDSDENPMKAMFVSLRPESVTSMRVGESAVLNANYESQPWTIGFAMEDGRWKVRTFRRGKHDRGSWQTRLLPKMHKRVTEHFDIYCFKGSAAQRDLDTIAQQRDRGFGEICRFLGKPSDVRIRMVLFEDAGTKYAHTGHQGAGWATGNMVVEIYNDKQKLDPYHETAHILMRVQGSPPALFNEGFATYISEHLGSHALASMAGGDSAIYDRVRELNSNGQLIELEELLTYTEIGSGASNPPVAYPEAASFVKFLIDAYGKEKFLKAYGTLRNSGDKSTQQQNVEALQGIYEKPLSQLKAEWQAAFATSNDQSDATNQAIFSAFEESRRAIKDEDYKKAWSLQAESLQGQYGGGFEAWKERFVSGGARTAIINLQPQSVTLEDIPGVGRVHVLHARYQDQAWKIAYTQEDGRWKICEGKVDRPAN